MLQTNKTLVSLECDDNHFSFTGLKSIRDGLMRNSRLKHLPIPVSDVISLRTHLRGLSTVGKKANSPSQEGLTKIIKDIEKKTSENYLRNKDKPDGKRGQKRIEQPSNEIGYRFIVWISFTKFGLFQL